MGLKEGLIKTFEQKAQKGAQTIKVHRKIRVDDHEAFPVSNDMAKTTFYLVVEKDGVWAYGFSRWGSNEVHSYPSRSYGLKTPVKAGTRWEDETSHSEILAIEDVTVPAGQFKGCAKVRAVLTHKDPRLSRERITWLCPGVGAVKWMAKLGRSDWATVELLTAMWDVIALEKEQEKSQKAPEQHAGGTSESLVKWTLSKCAGDEFAPWYAQIRGDVSASVELGDDQIARQLLQEGRRVYLRSCPPLRRLKAVLVNLHTPTHLRGEATAVSSYVAENEFLDYKNFLAQKFSQTRSIKSFIQRFKVEVWLDSNEMKSRLASNPFQWKGKAVGFVAEFGGMLTEDSGVFDLGGLMFIVVKGLPSGRFTRSGQTFLLAGRVQGVSQVALPFLGPASVPELSFIGAQPALSP